MNFLVDRINLKDYIFSENFEQKIGLENIFVDIKKGKNSLWNYKNLADFKLLLKKKDKVFLVLKELSPAEFVDIKGKILNLNSGVCGVGEKLEMENWEIDFLENGWKVLDVVDFERFESLLQSEGNIAFRILDFEVPKKLIDGENFFVKDGFVLNNDLMYKPVGITIFVAGGIYNIGTYLHYLLEQDGIGVNLIGIEDWNLENIESIKKYLNVEKVFLIADMCKNNKFEKFVCKKLQQQNIIFLYPDFQNIKTIYSEFLMESAKFDESFLYEKILTYLK